MSAYYNEHDPFAAAWLRELIADGLIAPGEVDERDIRDVAASDLMGYRQCHFFAGIGIWSLALRCAGWPDDRPVWTGSAPCQPFSVAGKAAAYADERHLWPSWLRLISECKPSTILGEQVSAAVRWGWLDDVFLSLESLDYAVGAADFPACSAGAPHIRQRLYWVAYASSQRRQQEHRGASRDEAADGGARRGFCEAHGNNVAASREPTGGLADADASGQREQRRDVPAHGDAPSGRDVDGCGAIDGLVDADDTRREGRGTVGCADQWATGARGLARGPTNGYWADAEWIACRDGFYRPTQPGVFPLAYGRPIPGRVGILRGAGNALTVGQAQTFIQAVMEAA